MEHFPSRCKNWDVTPSTLKSNNQQINRKFKHCQDLHCLWIPMWSWLYCIYQYCLGNLKKKNQSSKYDGRLWQIVSCLYVAQWKRRVEMWKNTLHPKDREEEKEEWWKRWWLWRHKRISAKGAKPMQPQLRRHGREKKPHLKWKLGGPSEGRHSENKFMLL